MKKLVLSFAVAATFTAGAQQFQVVSNQQLSLGADVEAFHPVFSPDGKSLLVTSENYDGLGIIDISTRGYTRITDMPGAGYLPAISEDGNTVIARKINDGEQTVSLYRFDVKKKTTTQLLNNVAHFNHIKLDNGVATYALSGKAQTRQITKSLSAIRKAAKPFVTEEDLKLVVYKDGMRSVVDPLSTPDNDVQYCWSSVSPDGTKLLFVGGNNAYVSDLNGGNLVNLGPLHSPQWCGNAFVVAMVDEDDGHEFTKSEIVIIGADGKNRQQLTETSSQLKMYPSVSSDGSQVAYHTTDGKLYLMTIKQK